MLDLWLVVEGIEKVLLMITMVWIMVYASPRIVSETSVGPLVKVEVSVLSVLCCCNLIVCVC